MWVGAYVSAWGEDNRSIDPYGVVLTELRQQGIPVLAKFRVQDKHHIGQRTSTVQRQSRYWKEHPQLYIGHTEQDTDMTPYFENHPSIGDHVLQQIVRYRSRLLDYSLPEVREKLLAIFREVIERYDVAGATLNFLRTPYCLSFPEKNAGYLTEFVGECRNILDEVMETKGIDTPILGALLPWDIDLCRLMGMEVDVWIKEGLLDYVSPSEGWVTDFNMDIRPWIDLAEGTRCSVYPAIIGMISHGADFCIPGEYEFQGRETRAKIMPEHVRALALRFFNEGAEGLSSFNLYFSPPTISYVHLSPLSGLISPGQLNAGERSYIYLRQPGFTQNDTIFLQLRLSANSIERRSIRCRIYERLDDAQAYLRFKAGGLEDAKGLAVFINGRKIPSQRSKLIPHEGVGFLYLQYSLVPDDIRDGDNEVIVQEIEIRLIPRGSENQVLIKRKGNSFCQHFGHNYAKRAFFRPTSINVVCLTKNQV